MPMPDPMRDGEDELYHLLSCADALHCENPLKVEEDWIRDYHLLLQGHIRAADFAFIRAIYPINRNSQLTKSLFHTHSGKRVE